MGKRISDEERQRILDLLPTGKSCREIANQVGRSPNTVSRVAASIGHEWGHVNLARAHEASRSYGAEARAETAVRFHQRANELLDEMELPHLVWNIGGKDNVYTEHLHDQPDVGAKFTMIRAAREAMRTVLDIDQHDNRAGEVDQAAGLIVDLVDSLRGSR